MRYRTFAELSPLHLEAETWERLNDVMTSGPSSPLCGIYDPENPWHQLIGDPMRYGCWLWTGFDRHLVEGCREQLPASLMTILDHARDAGADYALFDADIAPDEGWPVFDHESHRTGEQS